MSFCWYWWPWLFKLFIHIRYTLATNFILPTYWFYYIVKVQKKIKIRLTWRSTKRCFTASPFSLCCLHKRVNKYRSLCVVVTLASIFPHPHLLLNHFKKTSKFAQILLQNMEMDTRYFLFYFYHIHFYRVSHCPTEVFIIAKSGQHVSKTSLTTQEKTTKNITFSFYTACNSVPNLRYYFFFFFFFFFCQIDFWSFTELNMEFQCGIWGTYL